MKNIFNPKLPKFYSLATKEYKYIAENWISAVKNFPKLKASVICLDDETYSFFSKKNIECLRFVPRMPFDGKYYHGIKLDIHRYLLEKNKPYILSDADAIVTKDPFAFLLSVFNDSDIVFSRGVQSNLFEEKFGFSLCAGWCGVSKPSKLTWLKEKLLDLTNENNSRYVSCDQLFLNEVLLKEINSHATKDDSHILFKGQRLSLAVIDNKFITRGAMQEETLIWHPFCGGLEATEKMIKKWDKWHLSQNDKS